MGGPCVPAPSVRVGIRRRLVNTAAQQFLGPVGSNPVPAFVSCSRASYHPWSGRKAQPLNTGSIGHFFCSPILAIQGPGISRLP